MKFTEEQMKEVQEKVFFDSGGRLNIRGVTGKVLGSVKGSVKGSVLGNVLGNVWGDVGGFVHGKIKNRRE